MFGQPRCREWTPLATQQLRLRNLIQIVGYNIQGSECCAQPCSFYYTLHTTTMSAPFYTSEKLLSNHPKWREIDSELILKMSSMNVVVRIWRHSRHEVQNDPNATADRMHQSDVIVQTWGVNFNGLLHIGANLALNFTPKSFKLNTLVFQMIGGFFCSYDSIVLSRISHLKHLSVIANTENEPTPSKKIPIENKTSKSSFNTDYKSLSPSRGFKNSDLMESRYSQITKSQSPPIGCFKQSFFSYGSSSSSNTSNKHDYHVKNVNESTRGRKRNDSYNNSIYEHSPKSEMDIEIREYLGSDECSDALKSSTSISLSSRDLLRMEIEESETAENYDHSKTKPINKYRYCWLKFLMSEIRPSYTAEKLQKLHFLQYSIKKRLESVQVIKEQIYQKSAIENCEEISSQFKLADNEDFSRSETLSMSSREFSLLKGKQHHSSKSRDLGQLLSDSNTDLSKGLEYKVSEQKLNIEDKKQQTSTFDEEQEPSYLERRFSGHPIIDPSEPSDRRFTLPLNKLMDIKFQPSPSQRLRHLQLTRLAELTRFKRRLLQDERNASLTRLREMRLQRDKLIEENQDTGTELMHNYHLLSRKSEQLNELKKSESALKELCNRSTTLLQVRRWNLVHSILQIYPIRKEPSGCFSILGISVPASTDTADGLKDCREADLAVALGQAAHATAVASGLLGVPLRLPMKLMGSRTKLIDQTCKKPKEVPLFTRNKDSVFFRYGLFLLNMNIAQLLWDSQKMMTHRRGETLANLKSLLTPPPGLNASRFGSTESVGTWPANTTVGSPSLRSLVPYPNSRVGRPFNRFKDSVDGISPKAAMIIRKKRNSYSVGSYIDEKSPQSLGESASSTLSSEPYCSTFNSLTSSPFKTVKKSGFSLLSNIQSQLSYSQPDLTKTTYTNSSESCLSVGVNQDSKFFLNTVKQCQQVPKLENFKLTHLNEDAKVKKNVSAKEYPLQRDMQPSDFHPVKSNKCLDCFNISTSNSMHCSNSKSESDLLKSEELKYDRNEIKKKLTRPLPRINYYDASGSLLEGSVKDDENINFHFFCDRLHPSKYCTETDDDIPSSKMCFEPDFDRKVNSTEICKTSKKDDKLKSNEDELYKDCNLCDNDDGIMNDVIVLPSAEAVVPSSSHFTDSPFLFDGENVKQGLELSNAVLNSLQNDDSQFQNDLCNQELVNLANKALKLDSTDLDLDSIIIRHQNITKTDSKIMNNDAFKCDRTLGQDISLLNEKFDDSCISMNQSFKSCNSHNSNYVSCTSETKTCYEIDDGSVEIGDSNSIVTSSDQIESTYHNLPKVDEKIEVYGNVTLDGVSQEYGDIIIGRECRESFGMPERD